MMQGWPNSHAGLFLVLSHVVQQNCDQQWQEMSALFFQSFQGLLILECKMDPSSSFSL